MRFLIVVFIIAAAVRARASVPHDLWIWPGAYRAQVNNVVGRSVFVLQRHIDKKNRFSARGPSPSPWNVREMTFVFRLESRPEPMGILREFQQLRKLWEAHGVRIAGLQLDYDSPTQRLHQYRGDIDRIIKFFQRQAPGLQLSVTGLTDWAQLTNFGVHPEVRVYFQLYRGSREHSESEMNLQKLSRASFPFKIGLLPSQTLRADQLTLLQTNPNFQGFAEFHGGPR